MTRSCRRLQFPFPGSKESNLHGEMRSHRFLHDVYTPIARRERLLLARDEGRKEIASIPHLGSGGRAISRVSSRVIVSAAPRVVVWRERRGPITSISTGKVCFHRRGLKDGLGINRKKRRSPANSAWVDGSDRSRREKAP